MANIWIQSALLLMPSLEEIFKRATELRGVGVTIQQVLDDDGRSPKKVVEDEQKRKQKFEEDMAKLVLNYLCRD